MKYPVRLLPRKNYRKVRLEDLSDQTSLVRSALTFEVEDDFGFLRTDAIVSRANDCADMSCNHNGMCEIKDLHIYIKDSKERNERWDEASDSKISDDEWLFKDPKPPLFINQIKKIHNKKYPDIKRPVGNKIESISIICKVIHDPMKYNFWHFEIRYFEGNNQLNSKSATWKKNFFTHSVLVVLKNQFSRKSNDYSRVPETFFIK